MLVEAVATGLAAKVARAVLYVLFSHRVNVAGATLQEVGTSTMLL